ncbi:MAG TPA: M15 family metallopeptidase [Ignavibacteria bacterium]|nr:M15 family metallopeptidase [Ignavibacteria bacterium]
MIVKLILIIVLLGCNDSVNQQQKSVIENKNDFSEIPKGLKKLVSSYPDFIDSADANTLYWKDGTTMIYDDGKEKTFEEMLENPDLEDMFNIEYPVGDWTPPPGENFDPGRIRYDPFFKKMYGNSASEVKNNMVTIVWMPQTVGLKLQVNKINGVAEKIEQIGKEFDNLPENLKKYVTSSAGIFNWRPIAGTDRLSTHSFAIAMDINTKYSDYWRWSKSLEYKNKIPQEIWEVFEKYGFIWGGKWYHYDTMHFEYRPELLN